MNKFAPHGGWRERAYYVVDVKFTHDNPEHKAIFYTGFLNGADKSPGGYSGLFNPTYEPEFIKGCRGIHSMRVVCEIPDMMGGYNRISSKNLIKDLMFTCDQLQRAIEKDDGAA
ncbi:hypothetical protein [Roseicella sp. DB1501]|uniref:hypothetical protein n=1 Tax=Roseicella sp. DB1501 TaxID=2730925 RepID=UPI0014911D70|nr:hypothetical protein [Roseicella sp. DB1501]NOG70452.1 hypothetical protein [Roseicella sp. DB1501]